MSSQNNCNMFVTIGSCDLYRKSIRYVKKSKLDIKIGIDRSYSAENVTNTYDDDKIISTDFEYLKKILINDFILFEKNLLININSLKRVEYIDNTIIFTGIDFTLKKEYKTSDAFIKSKKITRECLKNLYFCYEKDLLNLFDLHDKN